MYVSFSIKEIIIIVIVVTIIIIPITMTAVYEMKIKRLNTEFVRSNPT
jgi:hypothetical protein